MEPDLHAARAPDFYLDNRMHGSMRRREATPASRASTRRAAAEASRRPYILDVFSRYIVGWTVQYRENAQLAKALIEQATEQQHITPKMLTLHADRGAPQRAKPVAFLLADLGITKTHSRPYTSSDNPYSESNFKTLKYRPEFPARFDTIEYARGHCRAFVDWYNHAHRHSGIGLMTPAAVHHGHAQQLHDQRARVLEAAYARNPERFVRKLPVPPELPTTAWINKPDTKEVTH